MNNGLKVLYIDDSQKDIENYGAIWKSLLQDCGFEDIDFRGSLKFDLELVEQQLPHLIIADNVLISEETGDELDNEGCQFIADLKQKFEHIVCILFTQASFSIKTLGQLIPNPDLFIPKPHFRSPEYRNEWIGPKIKKLLVRRPIGSVIFNSPALISEYKELRATIECILEQCLNDASSYEANLSAQIKLSRLTGGFSGASIFLMQISGMERFHNVPLVFRISNEKYIMDEVQNYKKFVSLQVPHDLRVELIGFGTHSDFGGALYAFALADIENTTTALSLLQTTKLKQPIVLSEILDKVFARANLGWYNNDNNGSTKLVDYFSSREEYNQTKDHRRIRGIYSNIKKYKLASCSIDGDYLSAKNSRFPLPRNIMDQLGELSIQYAVVHGDLNLNNIIVSESELRIALIDFEFCGVDHVFKDFVSLEVSSLDLFDNFDSFDHALKFFREKHVYEQFWGDSDDLIGTIRAAAHSKAPQASREPESSYLLCLAFHIFKVAALDNISEKYFVTMFASLCAALEKLSQVSET